MQEETNGALVAMPNISGNVPKKQRQQRGRDDEDEDREHHDANEDVAKMMAVDRFSANQIARSTFIRESFARRYKCTYIPDNRNENVVCKISISC